MSNHLYKIGEKSPFAGIRNHRLTDDYLNFYVLKNTVYIEYWRDLPEEVFPLLSNKLFEAKYVKYPHVAYIFLDFGNYTKDAISLLYTQFTHLDDKFEPGNLCFHLIMIDSKTDAVKDMVGLKMERDDMTELLYQWDIQNRYRSEYFVKQAYRIVNDSSLSKLFKLAKPLTVERIVNNQNI